MQLGFLRCEEWLEELHRVGVLQDRVFLAHGSENLTVRFSANSKVIDFGLGVFRHERHSFDLPVQTGLLVGRLPIVQISFSQRRAKTMPRRCPCEGNRFDFMSHFETPPKKSSELTEHRSRYGEV